MSASPAIIKERFISTFKKLRMEKFKLRKEAALLRRANKVYGPPAMNAPSQEVVKDDAPPTLEEMRIKAKELKISFNARTPEKKLLDRITIELSKKD